MNATYTVESLKQSRTELEELLPFHWEEIARDRDVIKLAPDWKTYEALEAAGQFHFVVVRVGGRMVGYHISFVRPHLHYVNSLSAITDIYWLHPDYRRGRVGLQLFKEVERTWKARGVQKAFTGTKLAHDKSALFERLGYTRIEYLYAKVLQ